jgi:ABC-type polysaccharide/polyol phosphate export permease
MDLRSRYRGSALGLGWSLLQPIAMTVLLCTVFHTIFKMDIRRFAPLLMSGLTYWNYVLCATLQGCDCFFQAESYIRQYPAPMAIYPLRTVLGGIFHFVLALLMVVALSWYMLGRPTVAVLLSLLPTLVLLLVFGWALATLFALVTVRFRDTRHLTEIVMQALFYLTPIIYPPDIFPERHLGFVLTFNPMVPFLTLLRDPLLDGTVPQLATYASAGLIALVTAGSAALALWQEERRLIFHL